LAQCPICRHQCDRIRGVGNDGYEHVVAAPGCVKDGDSANFTRLDTAASFTFEDHNNGFGE